MNARSEEIASALPPDLETLPRLGGFRLRGIATTRSESQVRTLFGVFALGFTAIALEMVLLNFRAWQLREPLRLNARERALTFREVTGWSIPVCVGLVSLVLALSLPRAEIDWSGWIYFSLIILVPVHRACFRQYAK